MHFRLVYVVIVAVLTVNLVYAHPTNHTRINRSASSEHDDYDLIDLSHLGAAIYGQPDEEVGRMLNQWDPTEDERNPEEVGTYLEGDILVPNPGGRNGLSDMTTRWSNGIVPFIIQGSFNAVHMNLIEEAITQYHRNTCIRFKPRSNERDYIAIVSGQSGCWSSVGKIGGRQEVNLQAPGCLTKVGTVVHELMHAIGFLHEQNRHERDQFVNINWQNIQPGVENNFDKASATSTNAFGVGYDYGSIMHYSRTAFSSNGQPTIVPRVNNIELGQREGFSRSDIDKINRMYDCKNQGTPVSPATTNGQTGNGGTQQGPHGPTDSNPVLSFLGGFINKVMVGKDEEGNTIEDEDTTSED